MDSNNPLKDLFANIQDRDVTKLSNSEFAERHFLNPTTPYALKDDPDGTYHAEMQVTDDDGNPIPGWSKDDPIPLRLRWYQREIINGETRQRVLRLGRRTGKSFCLGLEAVVEALKKPNAQILVVAPNDSHIKVLFEDYIRPLLRVYRHRKSGKIGIDLVPDGSPPADADFVVTTNTKKPHEIVITDGKQHRSVIRGYIVSPAARGQSASLVIIDEADYANTKDLREIVGPILMTRPTTRALMASTPTGRRDSFYYLACQDPDWKEFHHTYEVLPHFSEELRASTIKSAGGETSPSYKQEYLAEFGERMEGVFDQRALNRALICTPYVKVLETHNEKTQTRKAQIADSFTDPQMQRMAAWEAVQTAAYKAARGEVGSVSLYRPEYKGHGVITVGTDWNDVAGMQTVMIWWPPKEWISEGRIEVSRFDYRKDEPITSSRLKDRSGRPISYKVGFHNGEPGNKHDLANVKGIVIWHGRLETGEFSWQSAANRVAGLLSIEDFVDVWYSDIGYGSQVNKLIEGIMTSGQYLPDMNILPKAYDIDEKLLRHMRRFHPDNDPEATKKMYRTISFGEPYVHQDIDNRMRKDSHKDVMVNVTQNMLVAGELLLPFGELTGFLAAEELGVDEEGNQEFDKDNITYTGGESAENERAFGGLVTQMREWRVEAYAPTTGKPRYAGADHAIDALMLAVLAWHENFSEEAQYNIFRTETSAPSDTAEELIESTVSISRPTSADLRRTKRNHGNGIVTEDYHDYRAPLQAMMKGEKRPQDIGKSITQLLESALRVRKRNT